MKTNHQFRNQIQVSLKSHERFILDSSLHYYLLQVNGFHKRLLTGFCKLFVLKQHCFW